MAAKTFLQLVQALRLETGYANSGPTTVIGQTGDHERAVEWVRRAYEELQQRHDWNWLRCQFSLATVSGTAIYDYTSATDNGSPISRFRSWRVQDSVNPPFCYLQSAGAGTAGPLTYIQWDRYLFLSRTESSGSPSFVSVTPQRELALYPTPDDVYVVIGEYIRSPQVLANDDDVPEMPEGFHDLIVYLAMEDWGMANAAQEVVDRGIRKGRRLLRNLERSELPNIRIAGAWV